MPTQRITPTFVAKAKAGQGAERTIYWDEKRPRFGLMITARGHKSFVIQYRAEGGVSRRMTLKSVRLGDAKKEADRELGRLAERRDPLAERRQAVAAERDSLEAVASEYLSREGKKLRTADQRQATLERLVYPKLGKRQIETIRRSEIVRLLDHIEDERGPVMADRTLAIVRKIMNWHASRSDEFRSPIVRGMARTKPKERARERILSDDELGSIWRAAEGVAGPWGHFVRFLLLTATRRNEAAQMTWDEVKDDDWTIAGARYKTKGDVVLPLSAEARAVLAKLPRLKGCPYVFTTDGKRAIAGFSKFKRAFDNASGVTDWTLHDLRRTARSLMSRARVNADIAERCLGHVIPGVRGVYDRHKYRDEMLRAFEALAAQIDRIVNPRPNVLPLKRKGKRGN